MFKRILLILLALLSFVACSNDKTDTETKFSSNKAPVAKVRSSVSAPESFYEKAFKPLEDAYRLKPDQRVLLAVSYIHHFFSKKDIVPVVFEFSNRKWLIRYKDMEVGVLPELFDSPDFINLLQGWVKQLHQHYPVNLTSDLSEDTLKEIDGQIEEFWAPHLANAVHKIDKLWDSGQHNPALLYSATRAMVLLAFQGYDRLEIADQVPAKALAILAMTKTLTDYDLSREESLLAYSMGYSNHAEETAKNLSQSDAIRLFVSHDDQHLKEVAEGSHGNIESRYLYLMRLAKQNEIKPYDEWLRKYFSDTWFLLPVFKTRSHMAQFSMRPLYNEALPRLVILSVAQNFTMPPEIDKILHTIKSLSFSAGSVDMIIKTIAVELLKDKATIIDHFESGIKILNLKYNGPFLDSRTYQAFYFGYFFSSLYDLGLYYLDSLSSVEAANKFAAVLGNSKNDIASDFQTWYRNLAKSMAGKANPSGLINDLSGLANFGAPPLLRTLEEQQKYYDFADPALLSAVKRIVTRMDSRVTHQRYLGGMAQPYLLDLKLMEKLYQSVIQTSSKKHENLQVWFAYYNGDHALLQNLFDAIRLKQDAKLNILVYLEDLKRTEPDFIQHGYEQLIQDQPDNWNSRKKYAKYLENKKEYSKARSMVRDWLDRKVSTTGLETIFAQATIARLYYEEGRFEEGWNAIEPVVESQQAGTMELAAELLEKLGKSLEAFEMAHKVVARYPDSIRTRILLAKLYWLYDKHIDAAKLLKAAPHKISMSDWRFMVGKEFTEVFTDLPTAKGLAAFAALLNEKFGHFELQNFVYAVEKSGNHELAFKMSRQLSWPGIGNLVFLIHAYGNLKQWKGKEYALDWLRRRIPLNMRNPASMIIYRQKEYDLLWELITDPEKGAHADYVWLMRAAASAGTDTAGNPYHKRLIKYFRTDKSDYYHLIGRYLIGLATEKDLLALAQNKKALCEISYFIGFRAQKEGRYADASDWFRLSIETGLIKNGEYRWAYDSLYIWRQKTMSLARLSAEN